MIEPVPHDERPFDEWRDETALTFEELSVFYADKSKLTNCTIFSRRAGVLRKLAQILRQEI